MYTVPKKVNVPELFYQRFLADITIVDGDMSPKNTLLQKLASIEPTKRGRGMSRWLKDDNALTMGEWNALYQLAAEGRAHMQGADRETTLRPAICARVLAERMEGIGVDNPVTYTPKFRASKTTTAETTETTTEDTVDTDLSSSIPSTPPTVDQTADVEEADEADLGYFGEDIANG